MKLSKLAEGIKTSPILTFAAEINAKIAAGEHFHNLTIGDFDPRVFPIPQGLSQDVAQAYHDHETNYPGAAGLPRFRHAVAALLKRKCGVDYAPDDIQIASGSRPLIYGAYRVIVDPGDKVVYPVPSWNNHTYSQMVGATAVAIETDAENQFMPSADKIEPYLQGATLLALCSPQNPTGTVFQASDLREICELVVAENRRRPATEKPLYVLFDQVYWLLTFGGGEFHHAVSLCPGIRDYAVFIDGLSKSFAGTGIRVGWACGPSPLIGKIRTTVAHMGAWAPRPEQVAAGAFLARDSEVDEFLDDFRRRLQARLDGLYQGFMELKQKGYPVDAIKPQASIYLTVRIDLLGRGTRVGSRLDSHEAVHRYILDEGKVAILPFSWFGAGNRGDWFRLSVGTCELEDIGQIMDRLQHVLDGCTPPMK